MQELVKAHQEIHLVSIWAPFCPKYLARSKKLRHKRHNPYYFCQNKNLSPNHIVDKPNEKVVDLPKQVRKDLKIVNGLMDIEGQQVGKYRRNFGQSVEISDKLKGEIRAAFTSSSEIATRG